MTLNLFLLSESNLFFIDFLSFEQHIVGVYETNEKRGNKSKKNLENPKNVIFFYQGKSSEDFKKLKTTTLFKKLSSKFPKSKLIPIFNFSINNEDSSEIKDAKKFLKMKFPEKIDFSKLKFVTVLNEKDSNFKPRKIKKPILKTNDDLNIPEIPMMKKLEIKGKDLINEEITKPNLKNSGVKVILVECEMCERAITVPVPKHLIEKSNLPITEITYVHSEPPHAVTAYLDKDFAVRRRRASSVIFQEKEN